MVMPNASKSGRKRFRLASVRTLLVLVLVLAVGLAYLVNRASHRRRAAEAIRRAEGRVVSRNLRWESSWVPYVLQRWIGEELFDDIVAVVFDSSSKLTPERLEALSGLGQLGVLELDGSAVDDR